MMKKKEVKKKVSTPDVQDVRSSKFGLDYSQIIENWFRLNPTVLKRDIADKLFISKMGFNHRLKQTYYGNIFDLMELCLVTGHDFLEPAVNVLKNNGLAVKETFTDQQVGDLVRENAELKKNISRAARDNDMLHEIIKDLKAKLKNAKIV